VVVGQTRYPIDHRTNVDSVTYSKHSNTSVGEFSFPVSLQGGFISLRREAKGIEETDGSEGTGDGIDSEGSNS